MLLCGHGSAATDSKVVMVGGCWALFCSGNYASWLYKMLHGDGNGFTFPGTHCIAL